MDLTTLRYIVTIAEEKSLAKASERLFVTSSALSQCIKKLENDLGAPLFEKIDSRTFILTNVGKIYVDAASRILEIKEVAYREIQDVNYLVRGRFTFGCSPNRGLAVFSNVFPTFHKKYPKIRIDLKEAYMNSIYNLVLDGTIDIGMTTPVSEDTDSINLELLDQEEIFLAIPRNHRLAHLTGGTMYGTIGIEDLNLFKDDDWMLSQKGSMSRNLNNNIFEKAGFFPSKVLLETSSTNPHIIAVEEGIAVGFIPEPRIAGSASVLLLHLEPRQYRRLYATYRKNYKLSESQRFLIDRIKEFYRTPLIQPAAPHRQAW